MFLFEWLDQKSQQAFLCSSKNGLRKKNTDVTSSESQNGRGKNEAKNGEIFCWKPRKSRQIAIFIWQIASTHEMQEIISDPTNWESIGSVYDAHNPAGRPTCIWFEWNKQTFEFRSAYFISGPSHLPFLPSGIRAEDPSAEWKSRECGASPQAAPYKKKRNALVFIWTNRTSIQSNSTASLCIS